MEDNIKCNVVGKVTASDVVAAPDDDTSNVYEEMSQPVTPEEDLYESVSPRETPEPHKNPQDLIHYPDDQKKGWCYY